MQRRKTSSIITTTIFKYDFDILMRRKYLKLSDILTTFLWLVKRKSFLEALKINLTVCIQSTKLFNLTLTGS